MRRCSSCANVYPDPFRFCPVDGEELDEAPGEAEGESPAEDASPRPPRRDEVTITLRTLARGVAILIAAAILSFSGVFLYYYLKPRYGGLVIKTTPAGATVTIDGRMRGISPLTIGELRAGGHLVRITKEGFKESVQQVEVLPYATENLHWALEPLVRHLTNEQLAEIESWRKKLDNAQRENILLPPPDDYNAIYFAGRILAIDPANAYALDVRTKITDGVRRSAEVAYAREDWLEAEKHYKNLALLLPNDLSIGERLTDVAAKIEASVKDREKQIADLKAKADAALKGGSLVPPEKDNALEALQTILRLDKKSVYAREAMVRLREMLQNRGDTKMSSGDWQGAQNDFKLVLQFFPEDGYSKSRLQITESRLAEVAAAQQTQKQRALEEQQSKARITGLRQSALAAYRAGAHDKAVADWQEYLKADPTSDEAYYYLGLSYLEQKQLDTAILHLEKAASLNPSHAAAHLNLGLLYERHRNNVARAIEHLKKVQQLGGAERYTPERIQAVIADLQSGVQVDALQKVPFAVEHKHAFSSCRGNLRITADGIEYRTSDTDHSFYEAYGGVRVFSLQGDELSIRISNNKKYNFRMLNAGDGDRVRRLAARYTQVTQGN